MAHPLPAPQVWRLALAAKHLAARKLRVRGCFGEAARLADSHVTYVRAGALLVKHASTLRGVPVRRVIRELALQLAYEHLAAELFVRQTNSAR